MSQDFDMTAEGGKSAPRVMAIASGGGHWVQLLRLREAFEGLDVTYASTYEEYGETVAPSRFNTLPDVSRKNIFMLPVLLVRLLILLIRERPDVVVTTGALPGLTSIAMAKTFLGSRTIWIDSIANCEQLSTSGSRARPFADVYLTQWPHLAGKSGPDFWGAVL
jgi:UDP-N-acetylglucosamine:LPS N-acetylglucosamine transferase